MESYGFCFATSVLSSIFYFRWACSTLWFFFSWGGRIGEKGVDFEYCPALQKHIIMGEKKFSPLGLKQYFQLLCIFPDPYTVSKRNDFFCRCWKEYTHKRLWGLLWKNREMGHTDVPQTNGAEKEENIVQNMCSFENQIDSEGAVSRIQGLQGWVQRPGCVKPAHCVTQQESERHSWEKATG